MIPSQCQPVAFFSSFQSLCEVFSRIESVSAYSQKKNILEHYLQLQSEQDQKVIKNLFNLKSLSLPNKYIVDHLADQLQIPPESISQLIKHKNDPPLPHLCHKPISLAKIYESLSSLPSMSAEQKKAQLQLDLALPHSHTSLKYLVRLYMGTLGIGLKYQSQQDLVLGQAYKCMLAKAVKANPFKSEFMVEYKYDGQRCQLHMLGNAYKCFSRSGEQMEWKLGDLDGPQMILDGEIVIWNQATNKIEGFQALAQRMRHENEMYIHKFYAFDIIYLNGENLTQKSIIERKQILSQHIPKSIHIEEVPYHVLDPFNMAYEAQIEKSLNQARQLNCEGLMLKLCQSIYNPNTKTLWAKLKLGRNANIDTLDLIPIAGYFGKGKFHSNLNAFIMACYSKQRQQYMAICKLGVGFDQPFLESTKTMRTRQERPPSFLIPPSMKPDVWLEGDEVWEVDFDSFSLSERYSVGRSELGRGISLRFPRFVKKREDKGLEEASRDSDILSLFDQSLN